MGITASAVIALSSLGFVTPASAAYAATETTLTFEDGDTLGADAVGNNGGPDAVGSFEGATTTIENVPAGGGTGKGLHLKKEGQPWAGATLMDVTTSNIRITAENLSAITFDYYSPDTVDSPVMVKLENASVNIEFPLTASPGWNSMEFDFSTKGTWSKDIEYTRVSIFPNFGAATTVTNTGQVYVIDNFKVNVAASNEPEALAADPLFVSFEDGDTIGAGAVGDNSGSDATGTFSGATTTIVDVPAGGGSGKGLQIAKAGDPWSGVTVVDVTTSEIKITGAGKSTITLDYYSPDNVDSPLMLKLEGAGGANAIEFAKTASPGWNSMSYDFSTQGSWSAANEYTKLTIFPNFPNGTVTNTGQLYVVDNLSINGGLPAPSAAAAVLTFEDGDSLGALAVGNADNAKATGSFEGASSSIAAAPSGCEVGNSLHIVKQGADWAGVTLLDVSSSNLHITAAGKSTITLDYYSPDSVVSPVMLKIEGAGGSNPIEYAMMAVPGWQTLSFDFSTQGAWSASNTYTRLAIFPNFPNPTVSNSGQVYVIDNVSVNGGVVVGDCTQEEEEEPEVIAPVRTKAPAISGTAKVGKVLTASSATFSGTEPTISYRWYVCAKAAKVSATQASSLKCKAIAGNAGKYKKVKVTKAHVGKFLRVLATATNSAGTAKVYSATSKKIVK
ncbi:MAG: hypothetical protein RL038_532 [Actinomycetota bacterium]